VRRCLHSLLVGLLVVSPVADAARACGHLQGPFHCPSAAAAFVIAVDDDWDCPSWCPVEQAWEMTDCGCDGVAIVTLADDGCAWRSHHDCCAEAAALDATSVVVATAIEPFDTQAGASVRKPESVPTLAPAPPAAESVPAPPALEPVAPTPAPAAPVTDVAPSVPIEAPASAPEAATPAVPEAPRGRPAPRNAFEEADEAAVGTDGADPVPPAEPAEGPAHEFEPTREPRAEREPLRRWIDDTAAYAVMGRLVDVRGDRVEIVRADGRSVTVPVARLSVLDRGYVAVATGRIAASRPRPTETVGR